MKPLPDGCRAQRSVRLCVIAGTQRAAVCDRWDEDFCDYSQLTSGTTSVQELNIGGAHKAGRRRCDEEVHLFTELLECLQVFPRQILLSILDWYAGLVVAGFEFEW